jgi:dihydrodipicolinate synthase/N-acetylneuraminate lyase
LSSARANCPPIFRFNITPEFWEKHLLKLEKIKALKESNGNIYHRNRILLTIADKINVFSGNEEWFWNDSVLGAKGVVGIVTWGSPKLLFKYWEECRKGNQLKPWTVKVYKKLVEDGPGRGINPSINRLMYESAILNALVEVGGGKAGPPRKPYERLPEKDQRGIEEHIRKLRTISL